MKKIHVVAALIKEGDCVLAAQRGYGKFKGLWEFPGGKVEEGETPKEALVREIKEELAADIKVGDLVEQMDHEYSDLCVRLDFFWATLCEGQKIKLLEHMDARWLNRQTLEEVEWLSANVDFIKRLKEYL